MQLFLKILTGMAKKQWGPWSDCSCRSSLIWVYTVWICHFVRHFGIQNFRTFTISLPVAVANFCLFYTMIRDLAAAIIRDGKVPSDWEQSFIDCLYKGKGDTLERGNYRSLKLTDRSWKSWRGLWKASSGSWCQSTIPSLASSQAEALQTQSLLSGSCKRST